MMQIYQQIVALLPKLTIINYSRLILLYNM